jgi:uncharacterized repeat protein (TIGR03803 family)
MARHHKQIVPERTPAPRKTTPRNRTRAQWAIHPGWRLPLAVALVAGLDLLPIGRAMAQTFTTLHSFTAGSGAFPVVTNSDGAYPFSGLVTNSSGTTLYGTAEYGGSSGNGTVFAANTDGTSLTNLHNFSSVHWDPGLQASTNSDGTGPISLILSGNTLYGVAGGGGSSGNGTVFKVNTDGAGFTTLHSFTGTVFVTSEGLSPQGGLILAGDSLYGTTYEGGGALNGGTVFKVNTNGTGFTNLHSFSWVDGASPGAGLILSGSTLYGTTESPDGGTVFKVNTDSTEFATLFAFPATSANSSGVDTNSEGAFPDAGLTLSGSTLYGTAHAGGSSGNGTVFALSTNGTGFTILHDFTASSTNASGVYTNNGGIAPHDLVFSGNNLYGTAVRGGSAGNGTVFVVNTNSTGFTTLHNFAAGTGSYPNITNSDGASPSAGLVLSANTLYGTTLSGGSAGNGTMFSLSFRPQLTITFPGDRPVLSWPINDAGFSYTGYYLQYTRGTNSDAVWMDLVYLPIIVNGQFEVAVPWTLFLGQSSSSFRLKQ